MVVSGKSLSLNLQINLDADVRKLFGLQPEPVPKPSSASLNQEKVQQQFAQLLILHGPSQDQVRQKFIESLQLYNVAIGAHQGSQISELDSPFISTPELMRRFLIIQTAMQRDMIVNARDQAFSQSAETKTLWGTSESDQIELRKHFEDVGHQLTAAILKFDDGNADGAFAIYRRVLGDSEPYMNWMMRNQRQSDEYKRAAEIGIIAAAATVAVIVTDGAALTYLGPIGIEGLSGGARLGLLIGNGVAFVPAHRLLEKQILHIPFLRKEGKMANAIDLATDMGRTAVVMGTLKVAGEVARVAMPLAKTEPALAAIRNFSAEISGFNLFDVAIGTDPRQIFSVHHQLDQLSFLLGLRAANGVIGLIPTLMKTTGGWRGMLLQAQRQAELKVTTDVIQNVFSSSFTKQMRGRVALKPLIEQMGPDDALVHCKALVNRLFTGDIETSEAWVWTFNLIAGRLAPKDYDLVLEGVADDMMTSSITRDNVYRKRWVLNALLRLVQDYNSQISMERLRSLADRFQNIPHTHMVPGQVEIYASVIRALPPRDRLPRALHLVDRLQAGEIESTDALMSIISSLNSAENLKLAECLTPLLGGPLTDRAVLLIAATVPTLRPGKRGPVALRITNHLSSLNFAVEPRTRPTAEPIIEPKFEQKVAAEVLERMADAIPSNAVVSYATTLVAQITNGPTDLIIRMLSRLLPRFPTSSNQSSSSTPSPGLLIVREVFKMLPPGKIIKVLLQNYREKMLATFADIFRSLPEADTVAFCDDLLKYYSINSANGGNQSFLRSTLNTVIERLKRHERLVVLEKMVARFGWSAIPAELRVPLMRPLPAETILAYARSHANPELLKLALFNASGVPVETQYFMEAFDKAPNPEAWIEQIGTAIAGYRRGRVLTRFDDAELQLAYAGLDQPEQLTFELFKSGLAKQPPPAPFLTQTFRIRVPELRGGHDTIDKGVLIAALGMIGPAQQPVTFVTKLLETAQGETPIPNPLKTFIATKIGKDPTRAMDHSGLVKVVLREAWSNENWRSLAEVQNIIARCLVFLAWHERPNDTLYPAILAAQKGLAENEMATVALNAGLRATEEFFRDNISDAATSNNVDIRMISPILRHQKQLAAQLVRGAAEVSRLVDVDFVPSKSQTDRFFNKIGEDCTSSTAIDSPDFQIYRMIVNTHLTGALYVERVERPNGENVLIIAIQPRSRWKIDSTALLVGIERKLGAIAKQEGYRAVVIMDNVGTQSNRQDMLSAIGTRGYRHEKLSGIPRRPDSIFLRFHQNEVGVLVVWEKGMNIPVDDQTLQPLLERAPVRLALPPEPAIAVQPEVWEPVVRPVLLIDDLIDRVALEQLLNRMRDQLPAIAGTHPSPALMAEIFRAMREAGFENAQDIAGIGPGDGADARPHPEAPTALALRLDPLVARGTLVLKRHSPIAVFANPNVTRTDRGWIEPTLDGKNRVIETEEGRGELPATGREVTPQDLFDFYTIVMHQGRQFHAFLILLKNRGANVMPLANVVGELDRALDQGLDQLLRFRFNDSLRTFQTCDAIVTRFREVMRGIANTVGLDVDPVTGAISEQNRLP